MGRLVQYSPAALQHWYRDPCGLRGGPLRGLHPRAPTRIGAAENLGRFKSGYASGNVLGALGAYEERGEDILDWLQTQCSSRGNEVTNDITGSAGNRDIASATMVGIDMDAW